MNGCQCTEQTAVTSSCIFFSTWHCGWVWFAWSSIFFFIIIHPKPNVVRVEFHTYIHSQHVFLHAVENFHRKLDHGVLATPFMNKYSLKNFLPFCCTNFVSYMKVCYVNIVILRAHTKQSRFCTNLQLPSYVQKAASHIAEKAVQLDLAPGWVVSIGIIVFL